MLGPKIILLKGRVYGLNIRTRAGMTFRFYEVLYLAFLERI
jgi:hypothetical protein